MSTVWAGSESFLIPVAWSHSTGFLDAPERRWEPALSQTLTPALGSLLWLHGHPWVHCHFPLVEAAVLTSPGVISLCAQCEGCPHEIKAPSIAGTSRSQRAACGLCVQLKPLAHRSVWLHCYLLVFSAREDSNKTMDRTCANTYTLKVCAWAERKTGREG